VLREGFLHADLTPHDDDAYFFTYSPSYAFNFMVVPCSAQIDGAQIKAVRDQWHRRLDVQIASISFAWPAGATLVLPAFGIARWGRRWRRRRARSCVVCGYDLRASPIRCPECGTLTNAEAQG